MRYVLQLLSGPLGFLLVWLCPFPGLAHSGKLILAVFIWTIVWWVAQPLPWGIAALLPLVLYPMLQIMPLERAFRFYGQGIFFWIMGMMLLGYAMQKHGLAKRFALRLLSIKGVANSTPRLIFFYMLATGLISMFISDVATIAVMIPIGVSVVAYTRAIHAGSRSVGAAVRGTPLGTFVALGTLYASVAGGVGTPAGLAHNALSLSLLESLAGRTLTFLRWMMAGVPTFLALLGVFYLVLRFFFPPEIRSIAGGQEFIRNERAQLGRMGPAEKKVMMIFILMILLFALPSLGQLVLEPDNTVMLWSKEALTIWGVPPIILFLLFLLPEDLRTGKPLLTWRDTVEHAPWNVMLLCTGAVAQTDALVEFGFLEFVQTVLGRLEIWPTVLPLGVAFVVAGMTAFVSGTASTSLCASLFIPWASEVGANPASIAMVIPNTALGIIFPWAGAAAGLAFASGEIQMRDMIRVGLVASIFMALAVGLIQTAFSPIL